MPIKRAVLLVELRRLFVSYLVICLLFISFVPRSVASAQDACNEALLKNLQVAMLDCEGAQDTQACGTGLAGGTLSGTDNAEKVWNYFISKSLSPEQAAGVMGNLQAESGFIPDNQENDKPFGTGGWGVAQWTAGRRVTLVNAVLAAGLPYTNEQTPPDQVDALLAFELEYLYNESNARNSRSYPGTNEWEGLKRQATARDATYYWEYNFERPAVAGQEVRFRFAEEILKKYRETTSTPAAGCSVGIENIDENQDSSAVQCPSGTTEAGVVQDYGPGRVPTVKIRLCNLPTITQVNSTIAQAVLNMVAGLETAGFRVSGDSWRSYDEQAALRSKNGCPDVDISPSSSCRVPTAKAGSGSHEVGLAIDFTNMCFPSSVCPSSAEWQWLMTNAGTYGFKKNPREAWHWSPNGR